jgi:hypothetical protein
VDLQNPEPGGGTEAGRLRAILQGFTAEFLVASGGFAVELGTNPVEHGDYSQTGRVVGLVHAEGARSEDGVRGGVVERAAVVRVPRRVMENRRMVGRAVNPNSGIQLPRERDFRCGRMNHPRLLSEESGGVLD